MRASFAVLWWFDGVTGGDRHAGYYERRLIRSKESRLLPM
jgi:hypothetical protein